VVVADTVEVADGDVDAVDVLLGEDAIGVGSQRGLERGRQVFGLANDRAAERTVVDALTRAFVVGLDDHREREPRAALDHAIEGARGDQRGACAFDAGSRERELRHPFVERDRVGVGVRAGERDAELLEQGRVDRLPHTSALALGGVEDEVWVDGFESLEQAARGPRDLDFHDLVAGGLERGCDGADRVSAIELGIFFAVTDICKPEVVGERDFHERKEQ
jgi:hypothetical protein